MLVIIYYYIYTCTVHVCSTHVRYTCTHTAVLYILWVHVPRYILKKTFNIIYMWPHTVHTVHLCI